MQLGPEMSGWSGIVWNCPSLPDRSQYSWHWYFDGHCVQVQIDYATSRRQTQITDAALLTFDPATATPQTKTAHLQITDSMKPESASHTGEPGGQFQVTGSSEGPPLQARSTEQVKHLTTATRTAS